MTSKEIDLDFEFSNQELANFLENFAEKLRDGEVGLSFKGREEVEISPTKNNKVEMDFEEGSKMKKMEIEVTMYEEMDTTDEGRRKIDVKVV